jgi:hypothetical protein
MAPDGLIGQSKGHFDAEAYQRQLERGSIDPSRSPT